MVRWCWVFVASMVTVPSFAQTRGFDAAEVDASGLSAQWDLLDRGDGTSDVRWLGGEREPNAIWGGQVVTGNEFANVVALFAYNNGYGGVFCSGSVVHPRWVVTAAHCVEAAEEFDDDGYELWAVFLNDVYNSTGWSGRELTSIVKHPGYSPSGDIRDDIGVVQMASSAPVGHVVVNNGNPDGFTGEKLTFVGYGITSDSANDDGIKRKTEITFQYCQSPDYYYGSCVAQSGYEPQFLYSESAGTNVCQGDSGGAAFRKVGNSYVLAGVNSFVTPGCVNGGNGAVRVDYYLSWLDNYVPALDTGGGLPGDSDTDVDSDSDADADVDVDTDADTDITVDTGLGDPDRPPEGAYDPAFFLCAVAPGANGTLWLLGVLALVPIARRRRND